jgi:regulator of PEP synthase PpsR (kinase-PPPase family)
MAMQYGVFAANYPLTEEDFEGKQMPAMLRDHQAKLFGLTIAPHRLQHIRNERRPGSRYSSLAQCEYEVRSAESLFQRFGVPQINATECSIEEIASRVIDRMGIERRLRP